MIQSELHITSCGTECPIDFTAINSAVDRTDAVLGGFSADRAELVSTLDQTAGLAAAAFGPKDESVAHLQRLTVTYGVDPEGTVVVGAEDWRAGQRARAAAASELICDGRGVCPRHQLAIDGLGAALSVVTNLPLRREQ